MHKHVVRKERCDSQSRLLKWTKACPVQRSHAQTNAPFNCLLDARKAPIDALNTVA